MERIPASDRTREKLKALMEGRSEVADGRSELVRLAARLIIEEALEGEARDLQKDSLCVLVGAGPTPFSSARHPDPVAERKKQKHACSV